MRTLDQKTPANESIPPLISPFHLGPTISDFTTSLLFAGRVTVSMPGFINPEPLAAYFQTRDRAHELNHPLLRLFLLIDKHFESGQIQALDAVKNVKPLGDRIFKAFTVYPGTEQRYSQLESIHEPCLGIALRSLNDPQIMNSASIDFIFRVYELALEIGSKLDQIGDDPDFILTQLSKRAERLGGDISLLAECALNRYTWTTPEAIRLFTNSTAALEILAHLGRSEDTEGDTSHLRKEQLSFQLFDRLASPFASPLHPPYIHQISTLMDKRGDELHRMRTKCREEAEKLISEPPQSEATLKSAIENSLNSMVEEVSVIADLNRTSFNNLVDNVLEDKTAWTVVAGLLGSVVVPMPIEVTASLAITAFSVLGASAFKARNKRREVLKATPWTFIYYLRQGSKKGRLYLPS